jgi:hypothetical protein
VKCTVEKASVFMGVAFRELPGGRSRWRLPQSRDRGLQRSTHCGYCVHGAHLLPMDHDRHDVSTPATRCAAGIMPVAVSLSNATPSSVMGRQPAGRHAQEPFTTRGKCRYRALSYGLSLGGRGRRTRPLGERGRFVRCPDSLAAAQTARTSASRLTACSSSQQTAASHAAHACAAMSCAPSSRPAAL